MDRDLSSKLDPQALILAIHTPFIPPPLAVMVLRMEPAVAGQQASDRLADKAIQVHNVNSYPQGFLQPISPAKMWHRANYRIF